MLVSVAEDGTEVRYYVDEEGRYYFGAETTDQVETMETMETEVCSTVD